MGLKAALWWARVAVPALALSMLALPAWGTRADAAPNGQATANGQTAPATPCPSSGADRAAAVAAAARCHGRVEIAAARGEKTQVFANPDGSFTSVEAARVQRVRRPDGSWMAPDASLRRTMDGSYAPVAASLQMSFPNGGSNPAITIGKGAATLTLRWPGPLPAPQVSGHTLTYPEVLPGVDLMVTADVEGFEETLVVKSAQAAANPALATIKFATAVKGLKLKSGDGGSLLAVDDSGANLFGSGTPTVWDSSGAQLGSALAATDGARVGAMPLRVEADHISVSPDRSVLIGPSVKYPVFIDPAVFRTSWTMINSTYPNQSYWAYDRHGCPSGYSGLDCAKVGYTDDGTHMIYRSLFTFGTGAFVGKHVLNAVLSMDIIHSWSCSDTRTDVNIVYGAINSGTTWNNNASTWSGFVASVWNNSCHQARRRTEWGMTSVAQTAAAQWWTGVPLGLKAGDEANHNAWKKFDAGTAYLSVDYNSFPNSPDQLTIQDAPCVTGADRPYVKTTTPQLRAHVSDPDGGLLNTTFYWKLSTAASWTNSVTQASVSSGAQAVMSIPAGLLTEGATYALAAQVGDGIDSSQFSSTCEFTVDASPPGTPGASSSVDYPADGQLHGGVGIAGSFHFAPPSPLPADLSGFAYTVDTGVQPAQAKQVNASATTHDATVAMTPNHDGVQTLRVWSRDTAGNYSANAATYTFLVRAGAGPDARWTFDEGTGHTSEDTTGHGNPMTLINGSWTTGHGGGFAESLTNLYAQAHTAGPIKTKNPNTGADTTMRSDQNFTVSAWVRLDAGGGATQKDALSQDSTRMSPWTLGYSPVDNRWRFAMAASDTDTTAFYAILSNAVPVVGTWTYLVATYDASTHQMRMYVDGVAQTATNTLSGGFNSTGSVVLGRGRWSGVDTDYFPGVVDDIRMYARVVSPTESEFTNPLKPTPPAIAFPNGSSVRINQPIQVQLSAAGNPGVTTIKYSLGTPTLASSVTLPSGGGQATVTVTPTLPGFAFIYAASVDSAGRQSDANAAIITVTSTPALSGTVVDAISGTPVSGATVRLDPVGLSVVTGASGAYSFTGTTAGLYTVTATVGTACGNVATSQVEIDDATVLDLRLAGQSDVYGYTCASGAQTFTPANGTVLALTGDDATVPITLPFPMPFYGSSSTAAWVSTNGFIALQDPLNPDPHVTSIPAGAQPNAIIAPYWDDLLVDSSSSVRTALTGTAPNRKFIVEWRDVAYWDNLSRRVTFEAILSENGDVTFNYSGLDNDAEKGQDASVGIESPGGNYGLQYSYRTPTLANGQAVTYYYPTSGRTINRYTISGNVTNAGTGVAGATVTLLPSGLTAVTNSTGGYSFTNLETGVYTVDVTVECSTASARVSLTANTTANLALATARDGFGYECTAANRTFTPADATVLSLTGDDNTASVALPFNFPYYGQNYPTAWISTNGFLSFADQGGSFPDDRTELPNADGPNLSIYPYWNDLVLDGSSSVRTAVSGTAPNRTFTVEWRNAYLFGSSTKRVTFEAILAENGTITFDYSDLDNADEKGADTIVGIEDGTGETGLTYSARQPVITNSRAVTFTPTAP